MQKKVEYFCVNFEKMLQFTKGAYFVSELSNLEREYASLKRLYNKIIVTGIVPPDNHLIAPK